MSKVFKTTKGTALPLIDFHGKDYLQVPHRIVWFHEERPDWSIETDIVERAENSCLSKATIRDESGRIRATAYKFEDRKGFPDFIEKSGTGAIGRALAYLGYGTQFCAEELMEGQRLADTPVSHPTNDLGFNVPEQFKHIDASDISFDEIPSSSSARPSIHGDYVITFGKFKDKAIRSCDSYDLNNWCRWLESSAKESKKPLSAGAVKAIEHVEGWFKSMEDRRQ